MGNAIIWIKLIYPNCNRNIKEKFINSIQNIDQKVDIKTLLCIYKKELDIIKKEFPQREIDKNVKIRLGKINSNSRRYIREIKIKNERFLVRGIFIWISGIKYINYWINGEMNTSGVIYNKDNNKLYNGYFKTSRRAEKGEIYYTENEKYIGSFINNKREGIGIYYFLNGSS